MTRLLQVVDAAAEYKHYYTLEREDESPKTDRQLVQDVWSYLDRQANHISGTDAELSREYRDAANDLVNMTAWNVYR